MARLRSRRGWTRALHAMGVAARELGCGECRVGRVGWIGEGLTRAAYAAEVEGKGEGWPKVLVALIASGTAHERGSQERDAVEREARLIRWLGEGERGFRVPGVAVAVEDDEGAVLVVEGLSGIPIDLRVGRMGSVVPWEVVGRVAAQVHRIGASEVGWPPGHETRKAHGEAWIASLARLEGDSRDFVAAALDWLRGHLPPDEPSSLLHGDLLGQNLLLSIPELEVCLVDWAEAFRGDPAYDLAIVTRGVRRPFQVRGGLRKLLEVYAQAGGRAVEERHVRFHEIALHLEWLRDGGRHEQEGGVSAEPVLQRLRNLLRAVGAGEQVQGGMTLFAARTREAGAVRGASDRLPPGAGYRGAGRRSAVESSSSADRHRRMLAPAEAVASGVARDPMKRFQVRLVSGKKAPYSSWTFVVVPEAVRREWNKARLDVRGTINGVPFRGTVSKGEGVHRMPVKKELLERIGVARGQVVEVAMEPDSEPRPVEVPAELRAVLQKDRSLGRLFDALPPSHRRAWAAYVGEAKRPETRARRAQRAPDGIRARAFPT